MALHWRDSTEAYSAILRRHGVDPSAVSDVEAAWRAFREFLHEPVEGIVPDEDADADGFAVQWGRRNWKDDNRLYISFTRQFAVPCAEHPDDPDEQPEYWQLDLEMGFDDTPALLGLDGLPEQSSGFDFDLAGAELDAELGEIRLQITEYPPLLAAWNSAPTTTELRLDQV